MPQYHFEIDGDREIGERFETFPERARQSLEAVIRRLGTQLWAMVEGAEPDRTGALRRSTVETYREGDSFIYGGARIASDFAKAGALNYGAHRTITVRAHQERLGHVFGHDVPPMEVAVQEHQRRENLAERAFLSGAVDTLHDEAIGELEAALEQAAMED